MSARSIPLAILLLAAPAVAQSPPRRPPPRPAPAPARVNVPPRRPVIIVEPHRARDEVALPGLVDGPVAVDALGRASYVTDEGVLGQLAPDGNPRWTLLVGPAGGQPSLGADGSLYVAARDRRLYAASPDGRLSWLRRLSGRPVRGVAVGRDSIAVALENGNLEVWGQDGAPRARVSLRGRPSGSPVVAGPLVLVPLAGGEVVAVEGRRVAWRARVARAALGPLAVAGDAVYAGAADGTLARVSTSGSVAWRAAAGGAIDRSPILGTDGAVVVAAGAALVAFDGDGRARWRRPLDAPAVAGPLVADDGEIYVGLGGARAEVVAVAPDGARARRVARFDAASARGLALHDGFLWIGLADATLHRVAVPQRGLASSGWAKARGDLANSGAR